ncbi:protein tyrosine phosphatase family protein [Colwellia sp. 1_MG-2023]|uniref:protein tyrosine phosphatase family protein n=1 Tax=Colwellia sp. 1_MG-2023 TaxID=3062649 RepID=UPI0026E12D21|nr:protein tyrosine phosphatase family protein [Colwellia sp. 1_MG-2023]MDO6445082.1 protein tyrosine phosphatase family protein [Colwellia sp. 1_MG-2023]
MKYINFLLIIALFLPTFSHAKEASLVGLKNYQVNTPSMISSGLPTKLHFATLKGMGVTHVIDLIPGDRSEEDHLMDELALHYHNIQVEWKNPTVDNFNEYASKMNEFTQEKGKVLTHCRLNWRGAVFTYLYRVTHLNEDEVIAKADMLTIWQPDETWQKFINKVLQQAQ